MSIASALWDLSPSRLRERIVDGHPIDPSALDGWAYHGTSIGLPSVFQRLTWRTFQKTFWREPESGRLLGWNVRLEQDGEHAPSRPKMRDGRQVTTWHYEVIPAAGVPCPRGFDRGLIIDYGRGRNPRLDTIRLGKDPLVALAPGSADALLGVTYLVIGGRCLETPTYFTLEREEPISYVPYLDAGPPSRRRGLIARLTRVERRWAEALFAAILGSDATIDTQAFWSRFEGSTPPLIGMGLRGMVHLLTFLPLADPTLKKPFFALSPDARERFLQGLAGDRRYLVRQALATLKMLAGFAYFDDAAIRANATAPRT